MYNTTSMKVSHPVGDLSSNHPTDIKRQTYVYKLEAAQTRTQELSDNTTMVSAETFNLEVIKHSHNVLGTTASILPSKMLENIDFVRGGMPFGDIGDQSSKPFQMHVFNEPDSAIGTIAQLVDGTVTVAEDVVNQYWMIATIFIERQTLHPTPEKRACIGASKDGALKMTEVSALFFKLCRGRCGRGGIRWPKSVFDARFRFHFKVPVVSVYRHTSSHPSRIAGEGQVLRRPGVLSRPGR